MTMKRKFYYFNVKIRKQNNAAIKAPADIAKLCERFGMESFSMPVFPKYYPKPLQKIWLFFVCTYYWCKLWITVDKNSVVLYQHPIYGNRIASYFIPKIKRHKDCEFIAIVHDMESLRKGIPNVTNQKEKTSEISDNILLKQFDVIICHNEHMEKYLISKGFNEEKLVCLGIFDYLCSYKERERTKGINPSIAIAGNLSSGKCAYIYDILTNSSQKENNLTIHLYGENFDIRKAQNGMIYHGAFTPEELPEHLEGDFGLVWDGVSAKTCTGNTGNYLKYNNPHKTSLYLASGMPVIVWKQAAIADFIIEHNLGIAVDSLYNIGEIISKISNEQYKAICENVNEIGKKIRRGEYFTSALEKSIELLENE